MVCTISTDLLKNIEDELIYFSDLLMVFANKQNEHKVTKDKKGVVLDKYATVAENLEYITTWLDLMSYTPCSFEKIDVDFEKEKTECDETFFIQLCKATKGEKNLVVYSLQNFETVDIQGNKIKIENDTIEVYDRDSAKAIVSANTIVKGDVITESQVVKNGGKILKSKNK